MDIFRAVVVLINMNWIIIWITDIPIFVNSYIIEIHTHFLVLLYKNCCLLRDYNVLSLLPYLIMPPIGGLAEWMT